MFITNKQHKQHILRTETACYMLPSDIFREFQQLQTDTAIDTTAYSDAEHVLRTKSVCQGIEQTKPVGLNTSCCTLVLHVASNSFFHYECQFYVTMCQHVL
jgi:signal-transduction protein with cAMP-binding, CBS, and nucleotidyltransferase domain